MNDKFKRLNRLRLQTGRGLKRKRVWMVFSGTILVGFFLMVYFFILPSKPFSPSVKPTEPNPSALEGPPSQEPPYQVVEGRVKEGSTLFKSLTEKDIPPRLIDLVVSKLKPYVNFKKIKGGYYRFITDVNGELVKFIYEAGPTDVYEVEKDVQGYIAHRKEISLETFLVKVAGEIHSSLFEAMEDAGEQDTLALDYADILAWEIDFYLDVRERDRFKVVVEKKYKENQFIQYGPILAVEYQRGEKIIRGIRYHDAYYDEKGLSLKRAFLKTPLRFNRISSRFSRARKHPILGGVRPHYGVDYAAPPGTPVWAVADGAVVSCGWHEGYGKQVILRHRNGYSTYYGHLSGYAPKIRGGAQVKQKQVIGYVGSTGLSTGPHLDYRLVKEGRFRNPLRENFPAGIPIRQGEMDAFHMRRDEMLTWLQGDNRYQKRMEEVDPR